MMLNMYDMYTNSITKPVEASYRYSKQHDENIARTVIKTYTFAPNHNGNCCAVLLNVLIV